MRRLIFFIITVFVFIGCNTKTPQEKAQEIFEKEKQDKLKREVYIDSLVNVASGLEGAALRENRRNALKILEKEYPELQNTWDKVNESINKMEIYSEK